MNFSTATSRLKKLLLYSFAKKLNQHICFRCGKPINSVDDFTVDHKIAWQDDKIELFWDLENIAFSHSFCNTGAKRPWQGVKNHLDKVRIDYTKQAPVGKAWCSKCKQFLNINSFTKNKTKKNGLQDFCKSCKK